MSEVNVGEVKKKLLTTKIVFLFTLINVRCPPPFSTMAPFLPKQVPLRTANTIVRARPAY